MSDSVEIKCSCVHCNANIAFPPDAAGQTITCPHCGLETQLFVPQVISSLPSPANGQKPAAGVKLAVNPLGVAALVLGILSCVACWIPVIGLLSIPVALIGLLLAFAGVVMAAVNRKTGFIYPVSGGIVCILSIVIALLVTIGGATAFSTALKNTMRTNQQENNTNAHVKGPKDVGWAKSQSVTQGDIRVSVNEVSLRSGYGDPANIQRTFITLRIENLSSSKKIDFVKYGESSPFAQGETATLRDNFTNTYKLIDDGRANRGSEAIYPEQSCLDTIVFEAPVKGIEFFHLELSAENFRGAGMLRFEIPMDKIEAALDDVRKARETFASYLANKLYLTNSDYVETKAQMDNLSDQVETLESQVLTARRSYDEEKQTPKSRVISSASARATAEQRHQATLSSLKQQYDSLKQQLSQQREQLTQLKKKLLTFTNATEYQDRVKAAESRLNNIGKDLYSR